MSRPHLLLIKFNRIADVSMLLSKRTSIQKPLVIKADLTPEQRSCEALLLAERCCLIKKLDVDPRSIKSQRPHLYVSKSCHVSVSRSTFVRSSKSPLSEQCDSFVTVQSNSPASTLTSKIIIPTHSNNTVFAQPVTSSDNPAHIDPSQD